MFRRRDALPWIDRVRHFLWPRTGWLRAMTYYWHRLRRIPGTPASIAAGFACGLAVSFTPLVGLHTAMGLGLAWAMRGSLLAAFIGTLVVNPWTAPPVWISTYYLGILILPGGEYGSTNMSRFVSMFVALTRSLLKLDWTHFSENVLPLFWPMLVGGVPLGFAVGIVSYLILEPAIRAFRVARELRREAARARRAAKLSDLPPHMDQSE